MTEISSPLLIPSTPQGFDCAVDALRHGEVIAFPTETFYGLGADPFNIAAVDAIFQLKGRDEGKPLLLLVSDLEMLRGIVQEITPLATFLIKTFWPGPLTLIFPALPCLSSKITAGSGTIGVRISSNPIATKLVSAFGAPLTATSANPSNHPSPVSPKAVNAYFPTLKILDGATLPGTLGSTILDVTKHPQKLIREGEISVEILNDQIQRFGCG